MQTLFGYSEIPQKWKAGFDSVDQHMQSYKHILLMERSYNAFVQRHFPSFLDTFESYSSHMQRCDAIRYLWLYVHGGIYMDLDMVLQKSLEPLLSNHELALAEEVEDSLPFLTHSNCLMASVPRHPFWLECIDLMHQRATTWFPTKELEIVFTTGPGIVSAVAWRYASQLQTLPRHLVNPTGLCTCRVNKDSYIIPLDGGTWISPPAKFLLKLWCYKSHILALCCCLLLLNFLKKNKPFIAPFPWL